MRVEQRPEQAAHLRAPGTQIAGKSTLMRILYGLYHPDAGEIRLNGRPVHIGSPLDAIRLWGSMLMWLTSPNRLIHEASPYTPTTR